MMKHLMTYAAAMVIGTAATCYGSTVPFEEDFEGFGAGGEISGTSGWSSTDVETGSGVLGRALGSTVANGGVRGGSITNADLSNTFSDGQTTVFGSFYTRPYFGPAPTIPADSSVAFYVNDGGTVVAYSNTTAVTLSHTPISSNTYVKFTVSAGGYGGSPAYSLYLNDALIAADFEFYAPTSNSSFNAFQMRADSGTNVAYIDDVNFGVSSPYFQIVSNPVAGAQVTLFVGGASAGATYKVVGRDDDASVFVEVTTAVNSGGADPFPITDTGFAGSSAETRVYKIIDATGLSESTNETTWIADKQVRGSNQWHMVSVPGHFGDTNLNTLHNDLGAELAKQLAGNNTEALAPRVWIYDGSWDQYWMDAGDVFRDIGSATVASNRVEPGEGIWVKTPPQASATAILSGQAHDSSTPITMPTSNWVLFAWPFASPEANSVDGWGFQTAGFTAGTSWDNASRIFMQDGNSFYNLYLSSADGKWKIQNTTDTAPVSLRPGQAYYFYNAGGQTDYTAAPAN